MSAQNHEEINEITSWHNPFLPPPQQHLQPQQPEKHIVYFDDYDVSPPSYDATQERSRQEHQTIHTADADYPMQPAEDIPLNTYHQDTSEEPESAPLMMTTERLGNDCIPSAPSLDQIDVNMLEPMDTKTPNEKSKLSLFRVFLACCVWFIGITFMSVSLFGYVCFDRCESDQECDHCFEGIRKGSLALVYSFFALACVFATGKAVRLTLSI